MQRILYLIQKEFRQVFRDRAMLVIMFMAPMVQTVFLGFAMTMDVKNIKLIIYDADHSTSSRELSRRFIHNPYFKFIGYAENPGGIRQALNSWQAQIGIFIEPNFERNLQRAALPNVQIVVDGLDGNSAGIAMGYAQGILAEFAQDLFSIPPTVAPVRNEFRMWYNLDLNSKNYMVPGIIAVLLTVVTVFLTSMGLVREKEIGTLEQLMVTPIRPAELIIGKVLPFLLIGFVAINITLAVAFLVFDLTLAGSYLLLLGVTLLYFLTTLGLGIFVSTLVDTQQQAMFVSWFFMIFMLLMSGFLTPIANMPKGWQMVTYLNPLRYYVNLVREIFLKATPLKFLWNEIIPLAVFGLLILSASAMKFHKRVS
ncbi:MAG: ABC transporter permease [candidate division KSB1 bacterium]|nr:ABC transporter permease [candidate division KSB1 bacterium]MDZ7302334.1 ABC transporter permease [candidate division KSB1 bacterium]MDZ7311187.1 ABC transporter permease [candidate division KSB1 bacterium]